jgi:hypothetical protein
LLDAGPSHEFRVVRDNRYQHGVVENRPEPGHKGSADVQMSDRRYCLFDILPLLLASYSPVHSLFVKQSFLVAVKLYTELLIIMQLSSSYSTS